MSAPQEQQAKLASVKSKETVRLMLKGRKGPLVGSLLGVNDENDTLSFRCKWHKADATLTIAFGDVVTMEVKRGKPERYAPVSLTNNAEAAA